MLKINLKSTARYELIDITDRVQDVITKNSQNSGLALVYVPHTTAGIICNENETNLKDDILKVLKSLSENSNFFGGFEHDAQEGNAHAHIVSSICGNSRTFIFENGKLVLGTWQSIMFLEMDGPRNRQVFLKLTSS